MVLPEEKKAEEADYDVSPLSLGLLGAAAATMLGVGFKIGSSWKIEDKLQQFDSMKQMESVLMKNKDVNEEALKRLSAPPTKLARRALGYATLLCLSGATILGVSVSWYMGINSFEEWTDRLKEIVPVKSQQMETKMGPALGGIRDGLDDLFSKLTPILVKGRQDRSPEQMKDERKELEDAGIDTSILDPMPPKKKMS